MLKFKKKLIGILFLNLFFALPLPAEVLSVIPKPVQMERATGVFSLTPETAIVVATPGSGVANSVNYFQALLEKPLGAQLKIVGKNEKESPAVLFQLAETPELGGEGYRLIVEPKQILLQAAHPEGLFYGVQTLRQLMPPEIEKGPLCSKRIDIPCVKITDWPRYRWRGMHLDVSRHFFHKEFIKRYIDLIALHKMNVFHWHLTDDQGWRIEIKKYPRLTKVGAWRVNREHKTWKEREPQKPGEQATYGGYYTQKDIREIVAYAQSRFVTIVPEIEMPGHALAALASYPQLSCTGGPFTVLPGGYYPNPNKVFCAGKEETFAFLQDVLSEVIDLFPGKYIHIGGDEVNKTSWKNCPLCQQRIKDEGLKDEDELQSYFIKRIEKFLNAKGKILIGWDEILEGGLAPNAVVMSWRGMEGGMAAAKAGHDVVMTPTSFCYFDSYQAREGEPPGIGGYLPLEKVYDFEPTPADLDAEKAHHILGAQGNVWTEYIPTPEHVEYMALPRMSALSEVLWSPQAQRTWADFRSRMVRFYQRLAEMDVHFRVPPPEGLQRYLVITDTTHLALHKPVPFAVIKYTVDGTEPTQLSPTSTEPLRIDQPLTLKARTFLPNGFMSSVSQCEVLVADSSLLPFQYGLNYRYFDGPFDDGWPNFKALQPVETGRAFQINLLASKAVKKRCAMVFDGFLRIDEPGRYRFYLTADDGARLFLDDSLVVKNESANAKVIRLGVAKLDAGFHPIRVEFYNQRKRSKLKVEMEGPDRIRQEIPAMQLFHKYDE